MSRSPLARRAACAAVALAAVLFVAPSASAAPLAGPTNLRVAAITPHSVTLAWNAATNPGSFTYVIEAELRLPPRREAAEQTLHVDARHGPGQDLLVRHVGGQREGAGIGEEQQADGHAARRPDTARRARGVGDRHDLLERRPLLARGRGRRPHLLHVPGLRERHPGLAGQPGVDRRAGRDGASARGRDDALVLGRRRRPVPQRVGAERGRDRDHAGDQRHDRAERPGNLVAWDFGCETWLFWDRSVDDVDPQVSIRYEVFVNGVPDGSQTNADRWITYGTQSSNTFSVQAIDSAGNRSAISFVRLDNQAC